MKPYSVFSFWLVLVNLTTAHLCMILWWAQHLDARLAVIVGAVNYVLSVINLTYIHVRASDS